MLSMPSGMRCPSMHVYFKMASYTKLSPETVAFSGGPGSEHVTATAENTTFKNETK